jgi:hypothetical protein
VDGIKGRLSRLRAAAAGLQAEKQPGEEAGLIKPAEDRAFLSGWRSLGQGIYERIRITSLHIDETEKGSFDSRAFLPWQGQSRNKAPAGGETTRPDDELPISFSELSFFDLETTGLSGGAGTLAFLAAVGYFDEGVLHIHQLFIDDFPGEREFLQRLLELLSLRPNIVSFNGASFDIPLLKTRCVLNNLAVPDFLHIDALRLSRRLWKKSIGSCSLQSLEESILGLSREDDVPGFLIPRLWLDFIKADTRTEDSLSVMGRVVEHNSLDVRSLARLFLIADKLISESGQRWRVFRADPVALSRELFALGRRDRAVELLYEAGEYGSEEALALLARIYRRSRNAAACSEVLGRLEGRSFFVCIEMAKCFEHVEKNPLKALQKTEEAFLLVRTEGLRLSALQRERLEKRLGRLKRKLAIGPP